MIKGYHLSENNGLEDPTKYLIRNHGFSKIWKEI